MRPLAARTSLSCDLTSSACFQCTSCMANDDSYSAGDIQYLNKNDANVTSDNWEIQGSACGLL